MVCQKCQAHVQSTDRFCEGCGNNLQVQQDNNVKEVIRDNVDSYREVGATVSSIELTPKQIGIGFIEFFKKAVKNPWLAAKNTNESMFTYAVISIILTAILIPFIVYFILKDLYFTISSFTGGDTLPVGTFIIGPILFIVFLHLISIGSIYLLINYKNKQYSIKDITVRYGTLISALLVILITSFVSIIISIKLSLFFLFIGILSTLFVAPITFSIYRFNKPLIIDPLFGSIIILLLQIIVDYFYIQSLIRKLSLMLMQIAGNNFDILSKLFGY